jgi:hypothetical protein
VRALATPGVEAAAPAATGYVRFGVWDSRYARYRI